MNAGSRPHRAVDWLWCIRGRVFDLPGWVLDSAAETVAVQPYQPLWRVRAQSQVCRDREVRR